MKSSELERCEICIMDTTDPNIVFYGTKGCNHCISMKESLGTEWFIDDSGSDKLNSLISKIKHEGEGKKFDSILGLSGGLDSSYMALKAYDWGLRPLVVHIDTGWNSELAVANIQAILEFTGWELETKVINWPEMKDLQLSYLRSGVANQDVPQDHAIFANLYKFATKNKIRYVLNGGNTATEGIFPSDWHASSMDSRNLRSIQRIFGDKNLKQYETISFFKYYVLYPLIWKMRSVRLLNLIEYNKDEALSELQNRTKYRGYPRKHGESVYTRFFQEYYLPKRYSFDKRIAHLSSLIVSGQISRESALLTLGETLYKQGMIDRDVDYLCRKLKITKEEFEILLNAPLRKTNEFSNWENTYKLLKFFQRRIEKISKHRIKYYS